MKQLVRTVITVILIMTTALQSVTQTTVTILMEMRRTIFIIMIIQVRIIIMIIVIIIIQNKIINKRIFLRIRPLIRMFLMRVAYVAWFTSTD